MGDSVKKILEAILFVSTRPLSIKRLKKKLPEFKDEEIVSALRSLAEDYSRSERGVEILEVAGGFQMRTKKECAPYVKRFVRLKEDKLTRSSLETLAIVAFKQPITKSEVDKLRGVDSRVALKNLLDRGLVRMRGSDGSSSSVVFETTELFLEMFGLRSLKELPSLEEFQEIGFKKF